LRLTEKSTWLRLFVWGQDKLEDRWPEGRIRGHLLHYAFHGPGKNFNLTPTSDSVNQLMYHKVEKFALDAWGIRKGAAGVKVEKTNQIRYETTVNLRQRARQYRQFASTGLP